MPRNQDQAHDAAKRAAHDAPGDAQAASPVAATVEAPLYPVFLRLAGLPVVVVGGGVVAAGKLAGLLEAGAQVTVVAPEIAGAIRAHAGVTLVERGFTAGDLD